MLRLGLITLFLFTLHLAVLGAPSDTVRMASGLKYVMLQAGRGPVAGPRGKVQVNYVGKFKDGRIFDASALEKKPLKVRLGRGEVIDAWEEILPKLPAGAKLILFVPSELAYGNRGLRSDMPGEFTVPPNTDLIFEMEIVKIKPQDKK